LLIGGLGLVLSVSPAAIGPAVAGVGTGAVATAQGPEGVYYVGDEIDIFARGRAWADAETAADNATGIASAFTQARYNDELLGAANDTRGGTADLAGWAYGEVLIGAEVENGKVLQPEDVGNYESRRWAIADAHAADGVYDVNSHECDGCVHPAHTPIVYHYEVQEPEPEEPFMETPEELFGEVISPEERSQ